MSKPAIFVKRGAAVSVSSTPDPVVRKITFETRQTDGHLRIVFHEKNCQEFGSYHEIHRIILHPQVARALASGIAEWDQDQRTKLDEGGIDEQAESDASRGWVVGDGG